MLLILTGSFDGTSDLIFNEINAYAFRFNFDIFDQYEVTLTPDYWSIKNPTGLEISSNNATACFWWKATNYQAHEDPFINDEVKYIFREIYNWFYHRNLIKGTPPDFHNRNGKLYILSLAKKYFSIPDTFTGWGFKDAPQITSASIVAKSLSSGLTTTNRALFTTKVDANKLDPNYPWYLQETIAGEFDTTVFICGKAAYAFQRSRENLKGLDWRSEQDLLAIDDWKTRTLSENEIYSIMGLCSDLNVNWGRIDFLEKAGELFFLEYNANGQWVFLDYTNKAGLVDAVCQYLLT